MRPTRNQNLHAFSFHDMFYTSQLLSERVMRSRFMVRTYLEINQYDVGSLKAYVRSRKPPVVHRSELPRRSRRVNRIARTEWQRKDELTQNSLRPFIAGRR